MLLPLPEDWGAGIMAACEEGWHHEDPAALGRGPKLLDHRGWETGDSYLQLHQAAGLGLERKSQSPWGPSRCFCPAPTARLSAPCFSHTQ